MLRLKKASFKDMHEIYTMMKQDFEEDEMAAGDRFPEGAVPEAGRSGAGGGRHHQDHHRLRAGLPQFAVRLRPHLVFRGAALVPGKGLGTEAMRLIDRHYGKLRGLMLEVTETPDKETANRRIKFYEKNGYRVVKTGPIKLNGIPMRIMVRQSADKPDPGPVMHRILPEIYSHLVSDTTIEKIIDIKPLKK
jgi:hypothetical protein